MKNTYSLFLFFFPSSYFSGISIVLPPSILVFSTVLKIMCSIWVSIDKSNGKVNCFLAISLKTLVAHQNNLYVKNNVNVIGEVCLFDGDF